MQYTVHRTPLVFSLFWELKVPQSRSHRKGNHQSTGFTALHFGVFSCGLWIMPAAQSKEPHAQPPFVMHSAGTIDVISAYMCGGSRGQGGVAPSTLPAWLEQRVEWHAVDDCFTHQEASVCACSAGVELLLNLSAELQCYRACSEKVRALEGTEPASQGEVPPLLPGVTPHCPVLIPGILG